MLIATGIPAASASATGSPKPSSSDGCTSSVAEASSCSSSGCDTIPGSSTRTRCRPASVLQPVDRRAVDAGEREHRAARREVGRREGAHEPVEILVRRVASDEHDAVGTGTPSVRRARTRSAASWSIASVQHHDAIRIEPEILLQALLRELGVGDDERRVARHPRMYARISGASARDGGYRNGIVSCTVVTSTGASVQPGRRWCA